MGGRTLPQGTLTFLFTDLEGSTRLLHGLGSDRYGEMLEAHRRLIREAVTRHHGVEFGTGGDAVFVAFASAADAVAAAADAQRALARHPWAEDEAVRVRMALHTGSVQVVDDDYVGIALHVAARLCGASHGGQVLLSPATYVLAPDTQVRELGVHRLRDVPEAMPVYQLVADGLATDFPPPRTLDARPNNLPIPVDEFVGRILESIEVAESLREHRIVTLVGPGGAGKTRLATEVARSVLADFPGGVWMVELATNADPDHVVALVAQALGVTERPDEPLVDTVRRGLGERVTLLLLDNCEHVVDAAAAVAAALLDACPGLRVLATSRELLGVRGEQAIPLGPLAVDPATSSGEAVDLFLARARAAAPGFDPASCPPGLVGHVCRQLDGLPLAIELASARLRSLSLEQVSARLDDRFRLLGAASRAHPDRQRTLEAVVAWSYDLLADDERAVFRCLSVFPDTFSLEAAEAVAGSGSVDPAVVLDALTQLVEKSLVVAVPGDDGYRYQLLETLRQYGDRRLQEHDELSSANAALLAWVLTLVDVLERDMRTPRQDAAIRAVLPERANARAAVAHALAARDLLSALRIVSAVPLSFTNQRREQLEQLLAECPDVPPKVRAQALLTLSNLTMEHGDMAASIVAAQESAALFTEVGDRRLAAWARYFEVFGRWGQPDTATLTMLIQQSLGAFRELDDPFGLAYALWAASLATDDLDLAEAWAAESERRFRELGAQFGLAHDLEGRAIIAMRAGRLEAAAAPLSEALAVFADADNLGCTAHCLEAIAALTAERGLVVEASRLLGAADELRRTSGQGRRAWEAEARARSERALSAARARGELDAATAEGRTLDLRGAVAAAHAALASMTVA
jgi:predicted ATPase/class 3 adenylate cyclase